MFWWRPGTLLGVFAKVKVTPETIILQPGDTLVLYTDGITDVRPPHDLDDEALIDLIRAAAYGAHGAKTVTARLLDRIEHVLPIAQRNDDLAILVVQISDLT